MTVVSAGVLVASGVGHVMVHGLNADLHRVDPFHGLTDRPRDTGGVNFLVVGIDKRGKLSPEERAKYHLGGSACDCTDTLMLVHLSAGHDRASVVSLPRDTYTKLPPHTHATTGEHEVNEPAKLNSAYAHGGAKLTLRTVEALTRVHIDHYLEVDFKSFMKTVDVLGGVPVCTEKPLHDSYSGLNLPAGRHNLDGAEALQYVRARHLDGGSDLSRMRRQQSFLASVIKKATDSGVLMNPVKLNKVAKTVLDSVTADGGFGSDQLLELGRAMRGFDASSSEFASVPIADPDFHVDGLGSTVKWDEPKARKLFDRLREDKPLTPGKAGPGHASDALLSGTDTARGTTVEMPPGSIRVQVENGTQMNGLGGRVDTALRATGFATSGTPRNAHGDDTRQTTISYDPRWSRSARTLATALPDARLVRKDGQGPVMRVTVGTNYRSVRKVHLAEPSAGAGSGTPTTGGAVRGDKVDCS